MSSALLLGGGAPTLTLQSGALAALDAKGVEFAAISTAGAGMVIGLLYAAPKGMTRQEALENTVNMGVADEIYNAFPVNYKVFFKPGDMADLYRNFLAMLPQPPVAKTQADRLFGDWMALVCATLSPSSLSSDSLGLCAPAPWIDHVVDFEKLQQFESEFYINAYNVTDHKMEIFSKEQITPDHFRAALAFPFIYPPYEMNGKYYVEGSAIDTLCFKGLLNYRKRLQVEAVSRRAGSRSRPALGAAQEPGRVRHPLQRQDHPHAEDALRGLDPVDHDSAGRDRQGRHRAVRPQISQELERRAAANPVRHSRRSLALCAGLVV